MPIAVRVVAAGGDKTLTKLGARQEVLFEGDHGSRPFDEVDARSVVGEQ